MNWVGREDGWEEKVALPGLSAFWDVMAFILNMVDFTPEYEY